MSAASADRRIRALRPPKPHVDPWVAHGSLVEPERRPGGVVERALTVFLAGAECAFTCAFCDLWRYTIEGATPPGALPRQLDAVLAAQPLDGVARIKLYNASNFFDPRAVPECDLPAIAERCAPFAGVTVESHARTVGRRTLDFAQRIAGRLEVAIGLETIHPVGMERLNKRLDLDHFDRAADFVLENGIDLRAFVLLGAPYVPPEESVEWTVRTVEHAVRRGAALVCIIPVRGGNGELERLATEGHFTPPTLDQLEEALERSLAFDGAAVTADLWDVERLDAPPDGRAGRIERLRRMNLDGRAETSSSAALGALP